MEPLNIKTIIHEKNRLPKQDIEIIHIKAPGKGAD
jgi:hypothetical protein